jgi:hypothetical protein
MTTDPEELDRIAALAALELATADEERALAAAGRPAAARRREYADALAALAMHLPEVEPPPFASIAARLPATHHAKVLPMRRPARAAWIATGVALAAAAALAFLWQDARRDAAVARADAEAIRQRGAVALAATEDQCRRDADTLRARVAAYDARLGALSPRVELTTVRGAAGGTVKVFVDADRRRWLVLAFELPPVADKDYQLWFVPDRGAPISAGLLAPGPDGVLGAVPVVPPGVGPVRPAVSLEPRGGSPAPTDVKLIGEPI